MGEKMTDIEKLDKRIENLEKLLKDFMGKWGPDVQRRRDERDEKWDEMIRVLSIQKRDENE